MMKHALMRMIVLVGLGLASLTYLFLTPTLHTAMAATPWDAYNEAPTSRTLAPTSIYRTTGTVSNSTNLLTGNATRVSGNASSVTVDFGKEVGGIVTLTFAGSSDASQSIGLAFTESSNYIGNTSDASNGGGGADGAIYAAVTGAGTYTMPSDKLRGGFRYLTLFLNSSGWVDISGVSLNFTASPNMSDPAAYPNYFYSNDALLNRIWYDGAYTVQLNTISPTQGRVWGAPSSGWENNGTIGVGTEVLADGAKRDRTVWPGDMGISTATAYVSTDDTLATKNALTTLYQHQQSTGELPWAGPEVNYYNSDTYHMWTLIGTSNYYLYTADKSWLDGIWSKYQLGVSFVTNKIDSNGLLSVTGTADWARGDQGGENIEANALLYEVLTTGATLAQVEGNSSLSSSYSSQATSLKTQINALLWDASVGAYKDNPSNSSLHPQDGNSLAVWYNVTDTAAKAQSILSNLRSNWNSLGSETPEWNNNISPFPGSMEVMARFQADDDQNALALIRNEWGYMIDDPKGTGSTMWEGYTSGGALAYNSSATSDGSYTSLAHGWSTGPTSALTNYVLGVAPDTAVGQTYHVIPHPGNLTHVEGKLTVNTNKSISVSYDNNVCSGFSMTVNSGSNTGSTGVIGVPKLGQNRAIQINGVSAWNGSSFQSASGISSADQDSNYVYFRAVQPGTYTLTYGSNSCNTYEAESSSNTLSGQAAIAQCSGCSGGERVGDVGASASNTLQFNNVNVASAGTYNLSIAYTNGDSITRSASLSINAGSSTTLGGFTPTANASTVNTLTVAVNLQAGNNTLLFGNSSYWAPDFDRIIVAPASFEAEASGNTLSGGIRVVGCVNCSGDERVGWLGDGSNNTLQFNNINVAAAGTYNLTIAYTNGDSSTRSASISVNGGSATTLSNFTPTATSDTLNTITTSVTLQAGNNTILFGNSIAWGPDFDRVTLSSV